MDLSGFKFGQPIDFNAFPDNPWMSAVDIKARQAIEWVRRERKAQFAITDVPQVQALAGYKPPTILLAAGLVDMTCRLCERLITAGVFTAFGKTDPKWSPTVRTSVREHLLEQEFRWHPAYIPWYDDADRQIIFLYLLVSVTRFVVFHELGHLELNHGRDSVSGNSVTDGGAGNSPSRRDAVSRQARELAADSFALNTHFQFLTAEMSTTSDPLSLMIKEKLAGTPRLRLRMSLLSAFLVFKILDRENWTFEAARTASHPPAPFRMKALYATALNMRYAGLWPGDIEAEVSAAKDYAEAILSVGLNVFPDLGWLDQVAGDEFDAMFFEIHAAMDKWSRP